MNFQLTNIRIFAMAKKSNVSHGILLIRHPCSGANVLIGRGNKQESLQSYTEGICDKPEISFYFFLTKGVSFDFDICISPLINASASTWREFTNRSAVITADFRMVSLPSHLTSP